MKEIQILITGKRFAGSDFRAIEPVIEELINSAEEEIHIMAFLFTESAKHILKLLEKALERRVKIILVVNRIDAQPLEIQELFNSF